MDRCFYRAVSGMCLLHSDQDYQCYCRGACRDWTPGMLLTQAPPSCKLEEKTGGDLHDPFSYGGTGAHPADPSSGGGESQ